MTILKKYSIKQEDFNNKTFKAIMASDNGRILSVCYYNGGHYFQVECLKNNLGIVLETISLAWAIKKFNSI